MSLPPAVQDALNARHHRVDQHRFLPEAQTPSAFAPLQPDDCLVCRIREVWSLAAPCTLCDGVCFCEPEQTAEEVAHEARQERARDERDPRDRYSL